MKIREYFNKTKGEYGNIINKHNKSNKRFDHLFVKRLASGKYINYSTIIKIGDDKYRLYMDGDFGIVIKNTIPLCIVSFYIENNALNVVQIQGAKNVIKNGEFTTLSGRDLYKIDWKNALVEMVEKFAVDTNKMEISDGGNPITIKEVRIQPAENNWWIEYGVVTPKQLKPKYDEVAEARGYERIGEWFVKKL